MPITVSLVTPDRRASALRLLFARFPVEEQSVRLEDALRACETGQLNLDGLLLAEEQGQAVGAALALHQADGTSLVWPPVITCQSDDQTAVEKALMTRMCQEIDLARSQLAQVLLDPGDVAETALLNQFGFTHATDMFFMARELNSTDALKSSAPEGLDYELFTSENRHRFESVIEQTYQESLDCPFLDGVRSGHSALNGHRLSGRFDPAGWHLYQMEGQDVGVLLMNEHPEQASVEIVYFGVVPEFRGRNLGRMILADGIQAAALTGHSVLFLAVDCGNFYANDLYGELGFAELAKRKVMIRRLP